MRQSICLRESFEGTPTVQERAKTTAEMEVLVPPATARIKHSTTPHQIRKTMTLKVYSPPFLLPKAHAWLPPKIIRHTKGTLKTAVWDVPGGAVDGKPPASAGDVGSIPGPGSSHMPRTPPLLKPTRPGACAPQEEPLQQEARAPRRRAAPARHSWTKPTPGSQDPAKPETQQQICFSKNMRGSPKMVEE